MPSGYSYISFARVFNTIFYELKSAPDGKIRCTLYDVAELAVITPKCRYGSIESDIMMAEITLSHLSE